MDAQKVTFSALAFSIRLADLSRSLVFFNDLHKNVSHRAQPPWKMFITIFDVDFSSFLLLPLFLPLPPLHFLIFYLPAGLSGLCVGGGRVDFTMIFKYQKKNQPHRQYLFPSK